MSDYPHHTEYGAPVIKNKEFHVGVYDGQAVSHLKIEFEDGRSREMHMMGSVSADEMLHKAMANEYAWRRTGR